MFDDNKTLQILRFSHFVSAVKCSSAASTIKLRFDDTSVILISDNMNMGISSEAAYLSVHSNELLLSCSLLQSKGTKVALKGGFPSTYMNSALVLTNPPVVARYRPELR